MRKINLIVVHHSQNRKSFEEIKKLHVEEYKWDDIGYHFIIEKNGQILNGRDIEKVGAHVYGHNENSIGICLVGNFDIESPSKEQIDSLFKLINKFKYKIKFHCEFPNVKKSCPGKNFNKDFILNSLNHFFH